MPLLERTVLLSNAEAAGVGDGAPAVAYGNQSDAFAAAEAAAGIVRIISADDASIIATITVGTTPVAVAYSPDHNTFAVVNQGSNSVSIVDAGTNAVAATVAVGSGPIGAAYDGTHFAVVNQSAATISLIDPATNTVAATLSVASDPSGIAYDSSRDRYALARYSASAVDIVSAVDGSLVTSVALPVAGPARVVYDPIGDNYWATSSYVSDWDNRAFVINAGSNSLVATIATQSGVSAVAAVESMGAVVLGFDNFTAIEVYDSVSLARLASTSTAGTVNALGFSSNSGKILAVARYAYAAQLVEAALAFRGPVYSAANLDAISFAGDYFAGPANAVEARTLPAADYFNPTTDQVVASNMRGTDGALTALPALPADWITDTALSALAVAEIQDGLSTFDPAGDTVDVRAISGIVVSGPGDLGGGGSIDLNGVESAVAAALTAYNVLRATDYTVPNNSGVAALLARLTQARAALLDALALPLAANITQINGVQVQSVADFRADVAGALAQQPTPPTAEETAAAVEARLSATLARIDQPISSLYIAIGGSQGNSKLSLDLGPYYWGLTLRAQLSYNGQTVGTVPLTESLTAEGFYTGDIPLGTTPASYQVVVLNEADGFIAYGHLSWNGSTEVNPSSLYSAIAAANDGASTALVGTTVISLLLGAENAGLSPLPVAQFIQDGVVVADDLAMAETAMPGLYRATIPNTLADGVYSVRVLQDDQHVGRGEVYVRSGVALSPYSIYKAVEDLVATPVELSGPTTLEIQLDPTATGLSFTVEIITSGGIIAQSMTLAESATTPGYYSVTIPSSLPEGSYLLRAILDGCYFGHGELHWTGAVEITEAGLYEVLDGLVPPECFGASDRTDLQAIRTAAEALSKGRFRNAWGEAKAYQYTASGELHQEFDLRTTNDQPAVSPIDAAERRPVT